MSGRSEQREPRTDLRDFVRLPDLFRRRELSPVVVTSPNFHLEAVGQAPDGEPLFEVHVRRIDVQRAAAAAADQRARPVRSAIQTMEAERFRHELMGLAGDASLGELKARHREEHLCLRCTHHRVCRMATGLDPAFVVTISGCLGFQPTQADEDRLMPVELMPLEPLPLQ